MDTLPNTTAAGIGAEIPNDLCDHEAPAETNELDEYDFIRIFRGMSPHEVACAAFTLGAAWDKLHGWRRVIASVRVLTVLECHVNDKVVEMAGGKISKDRRNVLIPLPFRGNEVDILTGFLERLVAITKNRRAAGIMGDAG